MRIFKVKILFLLLVAAFIFFNLVSLHSALAINSLITNNTSDPHFNNCISTGDCSLCDFISVFIRGSDIVTGLAGIFSAAMFVYGGFIMITAYGNESRVKWGKDVLMATIVGIFVIMLAWTLVNVVILSLYGGTLKDGTFQRITGSPTWNICPKPPVSGATPTP